MTRHLKIFTLKRIALGALAIAVLLPVAQAQNKQAMPAMPAMQGGMAASSAMGSGGLDMRAMMNDMGGKMTSMPMSGDPDIDFAKMMRIHHQGAIDMANAELSNGKVPQMKKMAKAIIAAQKKEIAQFDAFLAKQGRAAQTMSK